MIIPQYAFAGTPGFATKRPSKRQTICHSKLHRNTHAQHQTNSYFFKLKVHSKHGSSVLKYPSRILGVKASPNFWSPIFKDSRLEPKGHRSPSGHATHVTTPTVAFATLMLPGEAKCCAGWSHQIWVSNLWQLFPKICFQMVFINSRQRCLKYIYVENDHRWW